MIPPGEKDKLVTETRLRGERHGHWLRDGVLGWMIVIPMLIGVFAGRWLDHRFNSGLFYTAPLLMLGAALGCWSAWKWMQSA